MDDQIQKQKVITYSIDVLIIVAIIGVLAYLSLTLVSPFLSILVWAAILAVALSPSSRHSRERLACAEAGFRCCSRCLA